ncbi:MAG: hypothetical protein K6U14_07280 [Firmicutes bacterium]|nr:hypothetical protein [Alicyclobacillaceae bacterium]MCL6497420.1 hypothetical protein [Bacillota bacterium]
MFDALWSVARLSPQAWARKQRLRPAEARPQYLRVLRAHTEAWMSEPGQDGASEEAVARLLRLPHEGSLAGMAAALAKGIIVPAQTFPDWEEGWRWLLERLSAWPRWLLWQAYTSSHAAVADVVAQELERRQKGDPSPLWSWIRTPGSAIPEDAAAEWSTLPAAVQLTLWHKVRLSHDDAARSPRPLGSGPWLSLLSRPEPPSSPNWKPLVVASTDLIRRFFAVADPDVRDRAFHALLRTARGRRALPSLFEAGTISVTDEERDRWTRAVVATLEQAATATDPLASAALALAPPSFTWPAWFRARLEADVALRGANSPFRQHIATWHGLPLDAFPPSVRTLWARAARTDAQARQAFVSRWVGWWIRHPQEAAGEVPAVGWTEPLPGLKAAWLRAFLAAGEGPVPVASLFEPEPFDGLTALYDHLADHGTLPYDRLPPLFSLLAGVGEGQRRLRDLEAAVVVAALRRDPAAEEGLPEDLLQRVRDHLAETLQKREERFSAAWEAVADALEALRGQFPAVHDLVGEILALRHGHPVATASPTSPNPADGQPSVVSDIVTLSVAVEQAARREDRVLSELLSPTEKCFDLGLGPYLPALEEALRPLGVTWVSLTSDPVPYDPTRHRLLGPQPDPPRWVCPRSPGLTRSGQVLLLSWVEPYSREEEVAP